MRRLTLMFVLALLFSLRCLAADQSAEYESWVLNNYLSCASFIAARDQCRQGDCIKQGYFSQWLSTYMAAHNTATSDKSPKDVEAQLLWLTDFCRRNPLESFSYAVDNLLVDLKATHMWTAPRE
jgi:hypothetical protein